MALTPDDVSRSRAMDELVVGSGPGVRRLPTGVVTFFLSDVEGSIRYWNEVAEDVAAAAIARHYELLDAAISLHGGARPTEQGEGDSVVGAFTHPSDAVAAALDAQRAFAEEPWPGGRPLAVRIALHTGEARLRGDDCYVGQAVIRSARLRAIAHGGQTLVSGVTADLVEGRLPDGAALRDMGLHRLKDLGRPERVLELRHPDLPAEFPPLRSLERLSDNLPVPLTSLVGRDVELADLASVLAGHRMVTLTGAGGAGKTRLAIAAAGDAAKAHGDGVWWVELGPVSDPDLVPSVVARTFGLREEEGRTPTDTLCDRLAGTDALLVLDNCEHLVGAVAGLVDRVVRSAPGLSVVATSREPLGIDGELTWRVPSLGDAAAAELFIERAATVRPGFAPDAAETEVLQGICRRLDGIPLAVELAAARVRMMSPERIATALDDRFRLLTGGARGALPRQRTLELSVGWSYDLLEEMERVLLRRLSVFAGGFTLEAAEEVAASPPLDPYAVLDLLSRLVDKSLVHVDDDAGERFRLLETIRAYARQRLVEAGEADAVGDRHLTCFLSLAERAEPEIPRAGGRDWLGRLEREHDNLRTAMGWAEARGAHDELLRLATALTIFWELHGHMRAANRWFARALAHDDGPSPVRARALWGAAHSAMYGGEFEITARRAPEALAMAEEIGDARGLARALNTNGLAQVWIAGEAVAITALERSIALAREHGDDWAVADGWKMMTIARMLQDDHSGAAAANEELRRVAERLGNEFFLGWSHCMVGWVAVHRGDLDTARRSLAVALAYDEALGGAATASVALSFLAEAEARGGELDAAAERLNGLLVRRVEPGEAERGLYPDSSGLPFAVSTLARLAVGRGAPDDALASVTPMIEALRPLGIPYFLSSSLSVAGAAHLALGDDASAEAAFNEADALGATIDNCWLTSEARHGLAVLARRRGETGRAEELAQAALAARAGQGLLPGVVDSLELLAALACDQESWTEAARLLGAASRARAAVGLVRWPADQPDHDANVACARAAVGDAAFDTAWSEGEALSVGEAVAWAGRARGGRARPAAGWDSLTPTELEVVKLAAAGLTNPQIGERLFIARGTVKTHLKHIFAKLGVATRAELASEATRREANR